MENSWSFVIFFQGPGNTWKNSYFPLYSWNYPGFRWRTILYLSIKKQPTDYRSFWFVDSIAVQGVFLNIFVLFPLKKVGNPGDFCGGVAVY